MKRKETGNFYAILTTIKSVEVYLIQVKL